MIMTILLIAYLIIGALVLILTFEKVTKVEDISLFHILLSLICPLGAFMLGLVFSVWGFTNFLVWLYEKMEKKFDQKPFKKK
jgi:hypothetical protein